MKKCNSIGLDGRSKHLRRLVIKALACAGRGHVGPSFSLIEILRVLYDNFLVYEPSNPSLETRDRLILSKGHGCLALYALLADKQFFPESDLETFCSLESHLGGHPEKVRTPGIEASTGSLGHGLPIGLGMAVAARIKKQSHRVIVILGDGEMNEGSIWEACLVIAKHKLSNISLVVDYNKFQCNGSSAEVMPIEPLEDKLASFGFAVQEVNGHSVEDLKRVFEKLPFAQEKPSAIICHTIKGKGVSFAENSPSWHYKHSFEEGEINKMSRALNRYATI